MEKKALEWHESLSQDLASVRPNTVYCYWQRCNLLLPVPTNNKDCSTEIRRILLSWRTVEAQFQHFSLQDLYLSNENAHESFRWRLVLRKNTFLFAGSIIQIFLSKSLSAFAVQDNTKFASFFPPAFLCSCTFDIISNHKF